MKKEDWSGELFRGGNLPIGFRISILSFDVKTDGQGHFHHYSGTAEMSNGPVVSCPNCGRMMFDVFNMDMHDPRLARLNLWQEAVFRIPVCPSCEFYMKPYWVCFEKDGMIVKGGNQDGGELIQDIDLPYKSRGIDLIPLVTEDYPLRESDLTSFVTHRRPPGVYHQIGGVPYRNGYDCMTCYKCRSSMTFGGIY
jgi:hypothetical protein